MKECPQCFSDIHQDDASACPACGCPFEGGPFLKPVASPVVVRDQAASSGGDEDRHFRRQFEERSLHLPDHVLKRAKAILDSAEAELRRVGVLLVDIRGYTQLGRQLSAEELSHLSTKFYQVCRDCILRRGGFIVKFLGDAVLAVFGAPVAFDQDLESTVMAALDIREAFSSPADELQADLKVAIGVAAGAVRSGRIDGPSGQTYDIMGDAVNLAARLQAAAGENEILVCADTQEVIQRRFELAPTPPLDLKNFAKDYIAYRVIEEKTQVTPRRSFDTAFIGREDELAQLSACLENTERQPQAPVVHIVGEAGIGKTRLVHEALQQLGSKARVVHWPGQPACSCVLLWPALNWLKESAGLNPRDSADEIQQAIRRYLAHCLPDEEADPLLLEYLLGVPSAVQALQSIPLERLQRNLLGILHQLVCQRSADETLTVLVADDLQWCDSLTLKCLQEFADWPEPARLAIVLIYRGGAEAPLPVQPDHLHLPLNALDGDSRNTLLSALIPTDEYIPEIRRMVLAKASGNPLFLEEMARVFNEAMQNSNGLNGEAIVNHIIDVIPTSLRELIQSRIDRLDARTRKVLQCASLLGLDFTFNLIELFDVLREGLSEHLHALQALRYLEERPEEKDTRYFFTNGLFRDVAYSTLLEEQKRRLHGALARKLEEVFADRIQEYYEILAFHYARAQEDAKAIYYLVKAADRQAGLGGAAQALENYSEAMELVRELPATPARKALLARVLTRCGRLHRTLGDAEEADAALEDALACAHFIGNERLVLEAKLERAITKFWRGRLGDAQSDLESILRIAETEQYTPVKLVALNTLGAISLQQGRYEEALQSFQSLASLAEKAAAPQVQADAFNNAGLIYWHWNQHAQALKAYKRALPLRRQASDKFGLATTLLNIAIIQEKLGKVRAAQRAYKNAMNLAEKIGFVQGLAAIYCNQSNLERWAGTLGLAAEYAAHAAKYAQCAQDPNLESAAEENLGMALAAQGDAMSAEVHLQNAVKLADDHHLQERAVGAKLSLLKIQIEGHEMRSEHLSKVNQLLELIQENKYADLLASAWRLKARILDQLSDTSNAHTAQEYLDMSRDYARNCGDYYEELNSWVALKTFHERHQNESAAQQSKEVIGKMTQALHASC